MPRSTDRQTRIALKARRTASRVTHDFIYENKIALEAAVCQNCGAAFDAVVMGKQGATCDACRDAEHQAYWRYLDYCARADELLQRDDWENPRTRIDLLWLYISPPLIIIRLVTL